MRIWPWTKKRKEKSLPPKLAALNALLPKATLSHSKVDHFEMRFTVILPTPRRSRVTFDYSVFHRNFHGILKFELECESMIHAFDGDQLFWDVINLIRQYHDIDSPIQECQRLWSIRKEQERERKNALLSKYAK